MSGELLRVRIERARSIVTVVRRGATSSSASTWSSQSPSTIWSLRLMRREVAFFVAPRPEVDSTGMGEDYAESRNETRTDLASGRSGEGRPLMLCYRFQ